MTSFEKLKGKLAELFMLDQADLDFGIYRIMNAKRTEISRFLNSELLPQVKEILGGVETAGLETQLAQAVEQAKAIGIDPEIAPKVQQIKKQIAASGTSDKTELENEVYSDLYTFFARYYKDGDFLSLRRYKEGVYAIPYEGEEVKLHWANHDQYYIKTSEYLRDYAFRLPDGRRVHLKIVQAEETEHGNVKAAANGKERRFVLCKEQPLAEENGELTIRFEYKPAEDKQETLLAQASEAIFAAKGLGKWTDALAILQPTDSNPNRTLLDKHLREYAARNTFDYFIHKDLGSFLRRELDFFIKNEILHLDDIQDQPQEQLAQRMRKLKALRSIAGKIIDFLAQIEDFQKRLWLKKKFVVETNYCITLDHILKIEDKKLRDELLEEIAANDAQREEWVRLFAIDEIKGDLHAPKYENPLSQEFLKANQFLILDTRFFQTQFKDSLLAQFDAVENATGGLLIHSDNFHALRLIDQKFRRHVKCVYIDPPYNTSASEILYKNDYLHSSWLAFIDNRMELARGLLSDEGIFCVTIDDFEFHHLWFPMLNHFGAYNHLGTVAIRNNPQGRSTLKGIRITHEYAMFFAASQEVASVGRLPRSDEQLARYDEIDEHGNPFLWENFRKTGTDSTRADRPKQFYPLYSDGKTIRVPEMSWEGDKQEWKINEEPGSNDKIFWPTDGSGSQRVWKWGHERVRDYPGHLCVSTGSGDKPQVFMRNYVNTEGRLPGTWWDDARYAAGSHGTSLLTDVFGPGRVFTFPKSVFAVEDCLRVTGADTRAVVLDFFAGSGTTPHAVINLNRADNGQRTYIAVEVGQHFDDVLCERIKKVAYSKDWDNGKPISREGCSHLLQYIRLESYEDALNNLELAQSSEQGGLLSKPENKQVREDYMLRYMLDVETRGSTSLLNVERFSDPFNYKLNIHRNGGTEPTNIDLVETFNYLLGLRVHRLSGRITLAAEFANDKDGKLSIKGNRAKKADDGKGWTFYVVEGSSPSKENVLVIWRTLTDDVDKDNLMLDAFFTTQGYSTRDMEWDTIYVNGDNNLENLRRQDQTWKVRLIEEDFRRLMFDVQDV